MEKSRYTESKIFRIVKEAEAEIPVPELSRSHGMNSASFYKWQAKHGGMDVSSMRRLKELEQENAQLKKMYADEKLNAEIIQEAMGKSGEAISSQRDGNESRAGEWAVEPQGMPDIFDLGDLLSLPGEAPR